MLLESIVNSRAIIGPTARRTRTSQARLIKCQGLRLEICPRHGNEQPCPRADALLICGFKQVVRFSFIGPIFFFRARATRLFMYIDLYCLCLYSTVWNAASLFIQQFATCRFRIVIDHDTKSWFHAFMNLIHNFLKKRLISSVKFCYVHYNEFS